MPDPAGVALEALWDKEWQATLLAVALEKVKAQVDLKQYQMFDLYTLKAWSARAVAQALGVSVARVYLAKHRPGACSRRRSRSWSRPVCSPRHRTFYRFKSSEPSA